MIFNPTGVTTIGATFSLKGNRPNYHTVRLWADLGTVTVSSSALQHDRIAQDPNILNGEPFVRGTRIPVSVILDGLAEGLTPDELLEHFPRLTLEDIRAAVEYAATTAFSPEL
jgi:uncharacterized protein (DUF433 family)